MPTFSDRLFVLLQYLLPRYLVTRLFYRLARIRVPGIKNALIRVFVRIFDVDIQEVPRAVPDGYPTFNAFFTRELRDGARPIDPAADSIVSPVDGTLSSHGLIEAQQVFQAKGRSYTLGDLLAVDLEEAGRFAGGAFATIYLAPYDYHRVHAPVDGLLGALHYVPGDLFSVNKATVTLLPQLFVRNERLVCRFATPAGPAAVILVGALNVGSMTTPWTGEVRARKDGVVEVLEPDPEVPAELRKGDLLGWFNMGSTVILLFPPDSVDWNAELAAGARLRMGEAIGQRRAGRQADRQSPGAG